MTGGLKRGGAFGAGGTGMRRKKKGKEGGGAGN